MIQFFYFDGCPNSEKTLNNLKQLIPEDEIEIIEVGDMKKAEECSFQGSPTILYNGKDLYTKTEPEGTHYTCRIYDINGEKTGVLSKEFIEEALYELQQQQPVD